MSDSEHLVKIYWVKRYTYTSFLYWEFRHAIHVFQGVTWNTCTALKSNIREDHNQNISGIQEVLKTKTIEGRSQIHHCEVLSYAMQGMKAQY